MAMADGLALFIVIKDLRSIKLPSDVRAHVLELDRQYKMSRLDLDDQIWLRRVYNRRSKQIKELHKSYEAVVRTDGRRKRGSARDKLLLARAKRLKIRRDEAKAKQDALDLERFELEDSDFGF